MTTIWWLSIGYNFGCVIASGTPLMIFGVKLSDENIAEMEGLREVAMATDFGTALTVNGFWRKITIFL